MVLYEVQGTVLSHVPALERPRAVLQELIPEGAQIGGVGQVLGPEALYILILNTVTRPPSVGEDQPLVVRGAEVDVVESLEGQEDEPYGNREQLLGESGEEAQVMTLVLSPTRINMNTVVQNPIQNRNCRNGMSCMLQKLKISVGPVGPRMTRG